jgi:hypothetical protein
MSGRDDDEADEMRRRQRERQQLRADDRLYGESKKTRKDGLPDGRSDRRTGRVFAKNFKMHPRTMFLFRAICQHESIPSETAMFEELLRLWEQHNGPIDPSLMPSDEEIAAIIEAARDKNDEA